MDCCYSERNGSPAAGQVFSNISSPEMFDSDVENEDKNVKTVVYDLPTIVNTPEKPTEAELVAKSDNYLLARINKFLCGVPPPPAHTICRQDCAEFLLRIYDNRDLFWTCPLSEKKSQDEVISKPLEQSKESLNRNSSYQRTRNTSRNLSNAFDACDLEYQSSLNHESASKDVQGKPVCDNPRVEINVPDNRTEMVNLNENVRTDLNSEPMQAPTKEKKKQVTFNLKQERPLLYNTVSQAEVTTLTYTEAYYHRYHGIHYNRNKDIEEFENLTMKLCERYIGAETQSTCNVWFSKQAPGSARKRRLLAKRDNGQSPGKRLSHLTRRRRTFSSANLQGLGLNDKKQLVLNTKKPFSRKGKSPRGKSPRGKSPRGKSPRGKSPRNSAKKKVVRRLALDGPSPLKARVETSKRALFQSPDRAGPSKLIPNAPNAQNIKRALFPTPMKREDEAEDFKRAVVETRKRKSEEELEGPRFKWSKSLSFDCAHELHSNTIGAWNNENHSSSNIIPRTKSSFVQGRSELSDTHRKKLLWAVAEALRSKGIGMNHPQFKQHASNLARTIKKFMPDLENRNIPRKPGSTSDRMLKLAKHHVLFITDARPAD